MNYPYLEKYTNSDIPILSLEKTLKYLNEITNNTNLPLKPQYLIVYGKDIDSVISVLLESYRIVPVIPIKLSKIKTTLKISEMLYYPDVNSENLSNNSK